MLSFRLETKLFICMRFFFQYRLLELISPCSLRITEKGLLYERRNRVPWRLVSIRCKERDNFCLTLLRDTVDSVGLIPKHVPFTKKNTCVKTFRHAIALDEHRVKFKPNLFGEKAMMENRDFDLESDFTYTPIGQRLTNWKDAISKWYYGKGFKDIDERYNESSRLQDQYTDQTKRTDALEVWFAGCHTGDSIISTSNHLDCLR